jgi:hypothetical protein
LTSVANGAVPAAMPWSARRIDPCPFRRSWGCREGNRLPLPIGRSIAPAGPRQCRASSNRVAAARADPQSRRRWTDVNHVHEAVPPQSQV